MFDELRVSPFPLIAAVVISEPVSVPRWRSQVIVAAYEEVGVTDLPSRPNVACVYCIGKSIVTTTMMMMTTDIDDDDW